MDNKDSNRLIESFTTVGGVLLLFGAAVFITGWSYAPYMYVVGSIMFAVGQFADRYTGGDRIMKRLRFPENLKHCPLGRVSLRLRSFSVSSMFDSVSHFLFYSA